MIARQPSRQVCPLCATDDFVRLEAVGADLWEFRCTAHVDGDFVWTPTSVPIPSAGRGGKGEELGIYEDLVRCVGPDEWVEYGIVEHRFAEISPSVYGELVDTYSHTSLGPTSYSATAFIAQALAQLRREGVFDAQDVPATGYWTYLRQVHAFAQRGTRPEVPVTSWASFAESDGIDPLTWPATGT
jgi:hypothetical protein